ncbi:MAG: hypothetical protein KAJ13_10685 [Gemmatimonadetes bacterium]|nr:hypothetical protein [Gemmatimonadota bacterium]MCK5484165.1 hypothetical protein [Gemmatimonadota bacterium]
MFENTRRIVAAALVALACMAGFTPAQDLVAQETTLTGDWGGVLSTPNGEIELVFKVAADEEGALSTTLDVPTQGAAGIPCTDTSVDGKKLHISGCQIPGSGGFDGTLNEEGVMVGDFNQAGQMLPLELKPVAESESE